MPTEYDYDRENEEIEEYNNAMIEYTSGLLKQLLGSSLQNEN